MGSALREDPEWFAQGRRERERSKEGALRAKLNLGKLAKTERKAKRTQVMDTSSNQASDYTLISLPMVKRRMED